MRKYKRFLDKFPHLRNQAKWLKCRQIFQTPKMAKIISGKEIAAELLEGELRPRVRALKSREITPKLVVILVGENPASASYIAQKEKFAAAAEIESEVLRLPENTPESEILHTIEKLNTDLKIHGIIVQLPLPNHISPQKVLEKIDPKKDVDGFSPLNLGQLFLGQKTLESCTPKGIIRMLEQAGENLEGKNVVIVGRSNIVGKPVALLALARNATVSICHSKTKNLDEMIHSADILIVATGRAEMIRGEQIREGTVVIDVGIHRKNDGTLCGDVHFESAEKVASKISPVPGGVGPMTVFSLIENTILAAENFGS